MKILGNPEEVGSVILFLVSSASSYITETALIVDDGCTAF